MTSGPKPKPCPPPWIIRPRPVPEVRCDNAFNLWFRIASRPRVLAPLLHSSPEK
jgi:hypothetical protein